MSDASVIAALIPGPWVALPLASGFMAGSPGYAPAYRIWRETVQLRGTVAGTASNAFPAATSVAPFTWPAAATPAQGVGALLAATFTSNSCSARLTISSAGVAAVVAAQTASIVYLDSVSYQLV